MSHTSQFNEATPDAVVGNFFLLGVVFVVFCLSAFAIYFTEIEFPVVTTIGALGIILFAFLLSRDRIPVPGNSVPNSVWGSALIVGYLISALWAVAQGENLILKTPIGLSFGVIVLLAVLYGARSPLFNRTICYALDIVLCTHVLLFFLQLFHHLLTNGYLDYVLLLTGTPSRYQHEQLSHLPRFTGFFAEPAQYSTFIFMALSARLLRRGFAFSWLDTLVLISVYFTSSVYGYFLALILVGLSLLRSMSRLKAVAFIVLLGVFVAEFSHDEQFINYLFTRTSAPLEDPSGASRLLFGFQRFFDSDEITMLFGIGAGGSNVSDGDIGNCIAYLLVHFGVFGTLIFGSLLVTLLYLNRLPWVGTILIFSSLIGAPFLTIPLWWAWLGFLCCANNRRIGFSASLHASRHFG